MIAAAAACALLLSGCGRENAKEKVELILKVPTLAMTSVCDPGVTQAYDFLAKAAEEFEENYTDYDIEINIKRFELTNVTGFEVFNNGDAAKVKAAKDFVKYIIPVVNYRNNI